MSAPNATVEQAIKLTHYQLATSSVIGFTSMASGPGLIVPLMALPSHAIAMVTCVRLAAGTPSHRTTLP